MCPPVTSLSHVNAELVTADWYQMQRLVNALNRF